MDDDFSVERGPAAVVARSRKWGIAACGRDEREALDHLGQGISLFMRLDERARAKGSPAKGPPLSRTS